MKSLLLLLFTYSCTQAAPAPQPVDDRAECLIPREHKTTMTGCRCIEMEFDLYLVQLIGGNWCMAHGREIKPGKAICPSSRPDRIETRTVDNDKIPMCVGDSQ